MLNTQENELIIQITQYIDKEDLEFSRIFSSVSCFFDGQELFKNHATICFALSDLCGFIGHHNKILSLDCGKCTFHVPVKFMGIVKDKRDFSLQPPQDNTTLGVGYSFSADNARLVPFFLEKVCFSGVFFVPMRFTFASFKGIVSNIAQWECGIEFRHCHFRDNVDFKHSFLGKTMEGTSVIFTNCIFHKQANFFTASFGVNTYFHRSTFKGEALFYRSNFLSIANFYFTIFEKTPNFSMCTFKDSKLANFIGVDISRFDMKNIEAYVGEKAKSECNEENFFKGRGLTYLQIQHTLNIRDSFRVIKETLNAQANILESQKWHKLELYAKEIELKNKLNLRSLAQEAQSFSEFKVLDELQIEVASKKLQSYLPKLRQNDSAQMLEINKRERLKNIIDRIQLWFYRHTSDHHTDLLKIISWMLVAIGVFGLLLFACKYGTDLETFAKNHPKNNLIALLDIPLITQTSIMGLVYLFGFCSVFWRWSRILFFSSVTLWIACYKPSLIFGAINLIDKSPRSGLENFLTVLYTLVMILLIFSLQKTARKNSIVPN